MSSAKLSFLWGGLLIVCCTVGGCGSQKDDSDRTEADTRFDENKALFTGIHKADQLALYEGLPHPGNEPKLFEQEKQTKETVALHGFLFYPAPLEITAGEKAKLRGLLGDEGSFQQWRGVKKCGGFHPDYLAEWRVGGVTYRYLICFGCHEVKVYSPEKSLLCDIRSEAYKQLEALLKEHRKNRPPSQEA